MSKIAFIYPGQGAQKAGMGKDFYEQFDEVKEIYKKASEDFGFSMEELCFEKNDRLDLTEYTQAALVTTCLAMTKVVEEKGLKPDVTAGLSLGEYCAIAAAGGMSTQEAVRTVRIRGILMQNTVPTGVGAMAAVLGMETRDKEEVVEKTEGAEVANYNCPAQTVITGVAEAVDRASVALKEAGAKRVMKLNVSGPFHSSMLKSAGEKLGEELEKVEWKALKIPYVTNVTADKVEDINDTKELLEKQVSSSVRWEQSMRNLIADGVDTFVEIGPGRTLAGFLKKIDRDVKVYNIQTVEDMESVIGELVC